MNDRFAVFFNSLAPRQYCLDFIVLNTNTNSTILLLDGLFKIIIPVGINGSKIAHMNFLENRKIDVTSLFS